MNIRLRELCQKKGITQKELAERMGVAELTLSRAAKGNTSLPMLENIAVALGVSVSELFEPAKEGVIICPHCGTQLEITAKEE